VTGLPILAEPEKHRRFADERFEEESDEVFDEEYRLLAKDGSVVWVREEAVVLRDGEGRTKSPKDLLRDVDTAMYRAKDQGSGRYSMFEPGMYLRAVKRQELENNLRRAVERNECVLSATS
jgi:GGDEF domain-containing protein